MIPPPPFPQMILPAEWEPQKATWLTWPQNKSTWAPVHPEQEKAYVKAIQALLPGQDVIVLCDSQERRAAIEARLLEACEGLPRRPRIEICPTNDSWIRDYGALTVRAREGTNAPWSLVSVDFRFNSWGGKYPPWDSDDAVTQFMAAYRGRRRVAVDFVLEGGSIEVDGRGRLLTTRQCLLNPNRNPGLGQSEIEAVLHGYLGASEIIWLEGGIEGDDTDGHVDDLARFSEDGRTVLLAMEQDARDENYHALKRNLACLEAYAKRLDLDVVEIPMPKALVKADLRTPATYLNFLVANGIVLTPVFDDRNDDVAMEAIARAYPGRRIIPLDCRDLVFGQGAIHCSSMQEPEEP